MHSLSQSPTDPAFVQNPYKFYDRARALGDLFWWDEYDMACATSHRAVTAVLRDRRLGRQAPAPGMPGALPTPPARLDPFYQIEAHSMLELDPPRQTRLRGLVLRAFTSRRIAALAPGITSLCDGLIDGLPDGPFDLIDAYAKPVPIITICRLLGVPEQHGTQLLEWSNAMVAMYQARRTRQIEDDAMDACRQFDGFMRDYIAHRRARPSDDLISVLIAAEEAGEKLSTDELVTTCILLLNAGHEATVHTMGNGVRGLIEAGRPPITDRAVEEVIRHDPPLHMFTRWVNEPVEFFGHKLVPGQQVACLLAAANADPAVYPDPLRFDPARDGPANTSFGGGIHFCVGAPLARLELKIALTRLFERMPGLRLAEPPHYADLYHFHGFERLMVQKS